MCGVYACSHLLVDNTVVLSLMRPWGHAQASRNEESCTSITKEEVGGCKNLWLEVTETFEQIRKGWSYLEKISEGGKSEMWQRLAASQADLLGAYSHM